MVLSSLRFHNPRIPHPFSFCLSHVLLVSCLVLTLYIQQKKTKGWAKQNKKKKRFVIDFVPRSPTFVLPPPIGRLPFFFCLVASFANELALIFVLLFFQSKRGSECLHWSISSNSSRTEVVQQANQDVEYRNHTSIHVSRVDVIRRHVFSLLENVILNKKKNKRRIRMSRSGTTSEWHRQQRKTKTTDGGGISSKYEEKETLATFLTMLLSPFSPPPITPPPTLYTAVHIYYMISIVQWLPMEKQQLCIVGRHFSMAGKKKKHKQLVREILW